MKITDWAILFVLIAGPLLLIGGWNTDQLREANRLQIRYSTALRTAAHDAGSVLHQNELQSYESGYGSTKFLRSDKKAALETLLNTLSLNLGIADDPLARKALLSYIPAVVVIEYDGYSVYAVEEFASEDGTPLAEHRWKPKKPFVYHDTNGNSISFTLDSRVTFIDPVSGESVAGLLQELEHTTPIPLLQDARKFEQVRRSVIVRSIEDDLARVVNLHNEIYRKLGVKYTFTLPTISQEEWDNTINDTGVLVFLQGIPVGDRFFNSYALGGGRLLKKGPVYGGTDPSSGMKYASSVRCSFPYSVEEVYSNARDAASAGYFEWKCP